MTATVAPSVLVRLREWLARHRHRLVAGLASATLTTLLIGVGAVEQLDRSLSDAWFGASSEGSSGKIVLVDLTRAASEAGDSLRLPRADLARLLDRVAAAGAERILVDLTLAGKTTDDADDALEAALSRLGPGRIALTASATASTDARGATHWARSVALDRFARHATQVASDLAFDPDGRLRRFGVDTPDLTTMRSSAEWLAGRSAVPPFPSKIDFSIDVRSVPVVDALDVMGRRADGGLLAGRDVLVANFATALGQEIRVPRFGSLRRPDITLLSAETVLRGRPLRRLGALSVLSSSAVLATMAALWAARLGMAIGFMAMLSGSVALLALSCSCQSALGLIVPGASPLVALALGYAGAQVVTHPALGRLRDAMSGMASRLDLRLARVLDETGEALVTFTSDGRVLSMNNAAQQLFATSRAVDGVSISDLIGDRAGDLMAATSSSRSGTVEATIERGATGRRHLDLRVNAVRAEAGDWIGIAAIRDVTEHRAQIDALRRMAMQDPLTGLPNRLGFEKAVAAGCDASAGAAGDLAVLLCDLDGFKAVNDTLGHSAGDALLREIGDRLRAGVPAGAIVSRLGGDEFGVVLRGVGMAAAAALARTLVAAVAAPISIDGHPVGVGVSIGVATHPASGHTPDEVVRAADHAMYRAKRARTGVACDLGRAA